MKHKLIFLIAFLLAISGLEQAKAQEPLLDTVWMRWTPNIYSLEFSNDDSKILTVGDGGTIIFDTQTGSEIKRMNGTGQYSIDGSNILFPISQKDSTGVDKFAIEIFDAISFEKLRTLIVPELNGSYPIKLSNDGKTIVAVSSYALYFIDFQTGIVKKTLSDFGSITKPFNIGAYLFTKDDQYFIISTFDPIKGEYGSLLFISMTSYQIDYRIDKRTGGLTISNNGELLAFKSYDEPGKAVAIMNTQTQAIINSIPGIASSVTSMVFSPDGQYLVVSSGDYKINFYQISDLSIKKSIYLKGAAFFGLDITKNNEYLAAGASVILFRFLSTGLPNEKENTDVLYPNPTNDSVILNFELNSPAQLNFNLYDNRGILISNLKSAFYNPGQITENLLLGNLANGVYYLKIESLQFNKTFKIIIDK